MLGMKLWLTVILSVVLMADAQPSPKMQKIMKQKMKAVQSRFTHMFRRPLKLSGIFAKLRAKHMAKFKSTCKTQSNLALKSNFLFDGRTILSYPQRSTDPAHVSAGCQASSEQKGNECMQAFAGSKGDAAQPARRTSLILPLL